MEDVVKEAEAPAPFVKLAQGAEGWELESNLSVGQAKWTVCELAAVFLAELRPKL